MSIHGQSGDKSICSNTHTNGGMNVTIRNNEFKAKNYTGAEGGKDTKQNRYLEKRGVVGH